MKDKLEQFISDNKAEWDDEIPDRSVWKHIEMTLDHQDDKKQWWKKLMRAAAVVVTLLSVGIVTGIYIGSNRNKQFDVATQAKLKDLEKAEHVYEQYVGVKLNEIKDNQSKSNVENELKQMDELYNQLRQEMKQANNANIDVIINAMLKNHQTKVDMLEYILQKQNRPKNEDINVY
jgi:hypothetical protein